MIFGSAATERASRLGYFRRADKHLPSESLGIHDHGILEEGTRNLPIISIA